MDMMCPTEQFLRDIDIHDILPQREPFILVDKLTYIDDTSTRTEVTIADNCIFVSDGTYISEGLIEIVAQTCAARIGYISKYVLHKGVSIGYIGAIRALEQNYIPKVGDNLICSIDILDQVFNMSRAKAVIYCGTQVVLTTEIKIVEKSES